MAYRRRPLQNLGNKNFRGASLDFFGVSVRAEYKRKRDQRTITTLYVNMGDYPVINWTNYKKADGFFVKAPKFKGLL